MPGQVRSAPPRPSLRSEPPTGARRSSRPPGAVAEGAAVHIPSAPAPARFDAAPRAAEPSPEAESNMPVLVRAMRVISVPPEAGSEEAPPVPRAARLPFDAPAPDIEASEVDENDIEDSFSPAPVPAAPVPAAPPPAPPPPAPRAEEGEALSAKAPEELESLDDVELSEEPPPPPPPRRKLKSQPPAPQSAAPAAPSATSNFPAPPKRPPRTEGSEASEEGPRSAGVAPATRRRPWWEIVFGEDFARADKPLSDQQISREVDFMLESLGLEPGAVILDLCCGQGQHAVELAARGYGVVGYDLSVYQLAIAGDNAQARHQRINFLQGDMREMAFEQMFDAVVCWDSSFGYFEEEKNHNVAERIFRALRPGGLFLLDVLNRDYAAASSPNHVWFEGDGAVCMDDMAVDWITSRLRIKRSLILDDGRSRECNYSLRLYNLHELGKLLHDVGFRVTQATGHIATPGVFFGPNSPRIIIRAQKPE